MVTRLDTRKPRFLIRLPDQGILRDYFPVTSSSGPVLSSIPEIIKDKNLPATMEGQGGLGPGEGYTIFDSRDILGVLPTEFELIIERGAKWLGIEGTYLCGVVEAYERRLKRIQDQEARKRKKPDEEDLHEIHENPEPG